MKKISWKQLCDYLRDNHNSKGVAVIKQLPAWEKDYSLEARSYIISGKEKYFYPEMISTSIWADNLDGSDKGVRFDWYIHSEDKNYKWQIEYCYILEEA